MMNFVIAAQLYTVRKLLNGKTESEIRETLSAIKDMGYDAVQISGVGKVTQELADMYKRICSELGLEICATHVSLKSLQEELDWVIEYHRLWDCKYIGIGSMPSDYRNQEGMMRFASECNEIGKLLKEHDLQLIYHNHKFEYEKFDGKTGMDLLYDAFDPEFVEFELDTYWVQAGGCDPVKWIYKVKNRMGVVHFKDMAIKEDAQVFAEIGAGNLDWDAIIEACDSIDVKYAAVEQDVCEGNPLDSLKKSIEYLKTR